MCRMSLQHLAPADLRLHIAPETLGFADTSGLADQPLPWIGQERAEQAARFGLQMDPPAKGACCASSWRA